MSIDLVLPHAYTPTAGALTAQLPVLTANSRQNRFDNSTSIGEATKAAPVPFTRIPDAVLLDQRLTAAQLRIYAVIARRADRETASAFPSYATIAKDADIGRSSAINGVKSLVSLGYLTKLPQQSGQGDLTSNRYTISGEGSRIFTPRGPNSVTEAQDVVRDLNHGSVNPIPPVVQNLDYGGAESVPPVVQNLDQGGANFGHQLDSKNQKQKNKTQDNRIAPAHTHEASAADAPDSELQALFTDFQENIGALTAMAKQVIGDLAAEHSTDQVRKAIQEAVIYEKRSLGYMRRVLRAWKQSDRITEPSLAARTVGSTTAKAPATETMSAPDLCWPPPGMDDDLAETPQDKDDPASVAWSAISQQLPQLGRLTRLVTPVSLVGYVLTVSVSDARTYSVLTNTQRQLVEHVTRSILGDDVSLYVEMIEREAGAA